MSCCYATLLHFYLHSISITSYLLFMEVADGESLASDNEALAAWSKVGWMSHSFRIEVLDCKAVTSFRARLLPPLVLQLTPRRSRHSVFSRIAFLIWSTNFSRDDSTVWPISVKVGCAGSLLMKVATLLCTCAAK